MERPLLSFRRVGVDDEEGFDEPVVFGPPPSADDRLWRHPSEMVAAAPPRRRGRGGSLRLAAGAGVLGALGAVVVLATMGSFDLSEPGPRSPPARPAFDRGTFGADAAPSVLASELAAPAVVRLEVTGDDTRVDTVGSGVVYRAEGYVLTSAQVIAGAEPGAITVQLNDGRRMAASTVGFDTGRDIAVVRLESGGPFPTAPGASIYDLQVGQATSVLGAAWATRSVLTLTSGRVTAIGRDVRAEDGRMMYDLLVTDALVSLGASGGALVGPDGRIIGITTGFFPAGVPGAGEGYAVPIELAMAIGDDLIAFGAHRPGWVGVRGQALPRGGVVLVEVVPDGPAGRAGLTNGDVVLTVDGNPVTSMAQVRIAVQARHPGDTVPIGARRTGTPFDALVTLGAS